MCHTCWYGYNTPKWKAFECSMVIWRRDIGKRKAIDPNNENRTAEENEKINNEWASQPLPYDDWFKTDECIKWIDAEWPNGSLKDAVKQSIGEHNGIQR